MYLLNELIFLSPLAVYVAWRLRTLIPRRALKNLSTLLLFLLVLGYPAAERLAHGPGGAGQRRLVAAAYYALPFLLYLVLAVIVSDAVIGLLRLAGALSREAVRRPRLRRGRLALVLAAPALVLAYGIWNHHHLHVSAYSIEVPRRSSPAESVRMVFASDFHLGTMTDPDFLRRFTAKVNALEPDVVLIGGDIVEGHRGEDQAELAARFREFRTKYGIYAVAGNHERYGRVTGDFFERAGIRLLRDEVVTVGGAFDLAGRVDDSHGRRRKSLPAILGDGPRGLPLILLDHTPRRLDEAAGAGVDVQLSGHTHNGQLFPMNLIYRRFYELSWGHLVKGRTHYFVTSGVQLWGPPVRTAGVSEIMLIDVAFR
jgi:hypothetical protein